MEITEEFLLRSNIIILSMEISRCSEREPLFEELLIESRIRLLSLTAKQTMSKIFPMKESISDEPASPVGIFFVDVSNPEEILALREKSPKAIIDLWDPNFNEWFNLNYGETSIFTNQDEFCKETIETFGKKMSPKSIESVLFDYVLID